MIRNLRAKLVAVSLLSLLLVLTVILGVVNAWNYQDLVEDADSILLLLADNQGEFPQDGGDFNWREEGPRHKSPELPYEARYFSVSLSPAGQVLSADMGNIAAVDEDTAVTYAVSVWEKGDQQGFVGDYRYRLVRAGENAQVIFLDYGGHLFTFRTILWKSIGVSLLGILMVLLLLILLSGRIIKPVLEGYEKQRRFITDAGHELKTPIAILQADAEVLETEWGESQWLEDMQAQIRRLTALTNDLICLSRMEESQTVVAPVAFSQLVQESVQAFQTMAQAGKKTISAQIQPGLFLLGEEKNLRQLVSILLDNALKYSPEGGEVALYLGRQGKALRLTVKNTAEGVTKSLLENMFDRFYRGDVSRNSQTEGSGIGLSIAKAVVAAHKGKIAAASRDGRSLVITVTLPQSNLG